MATDLLAVIARRKREHGNEHGVNTVADQTPVGIVLDRDGLPGWRCATCDGTLFWCRGDVPPAWGPWRCNACEPRPAEMLAHAVSLPASAQSSSGEPSGAPR